MLSTQISAHDQPLIPTGKAALLPTDVSRAGDRHPFSGALFAVGESCGQDCTPCGPLKVTGGEKGGEAVEIECAAVARERGLSWFEGRADETSEIPLDRTEAGVLKVRPDEACAGLEDIFLVGIAMQGLLGQVKRGDFGGDYLEAAAEHGDVGGIGCIPRRNLIVIPRSDFVQPLRDFRKRTQRPQRARIASQLRMQLAKEWACFIGTGYVVAVVLDELPEGQSETIVLVRTGRQFPAGRDRGEGSGREISGEIENRARAIALRACEPAQLS